MQHPHPDPPAILIAERDQTVRELQRFFLEGAGFRVEFADDGQAALDRARLTLPTLVVTEILIPKLDGLTLCRRLREDPATSAIPVVVFSILAAAARASRSLIASPSPSCGTGITAIARAPAPSSARRCENRLAAASIRSPPAERLSVFLLRAAPSGSAAPNASKASPGSMSSASSRMRVRGA